MSIYPELRFLVPLADGAMFETDKYTAARERMEQEDTCIYERQPDIDFRCDHCGKAGTQEVTTSNDTVHEAWYCGKCYTAMKEASEGQ